MKGLIIKDILSLRKNIKMMGAMLLFFAVFAFIGNDVTFVSGMATLLMTMLTVTTLAYDEASKWDRYALSLPITRKQLVLSKYLLTLLLALGGAVISLIILLTASLTGNGISVIEALATVYGLFWVSLVFTGILLPLTYKFGVEKSGCSSSPYSACRRLASTFCTMPASRCRMRRRLRCLPGFPRLFLPRYLPYPV